MFLNWMLQSKEFNPENFNTPAINLKRHASKQELHGGNNGEITAQRPQGNMQELFNCMRPLLKGFLACLTFHRKEIRLRHLHKRTNPESAPVCNIFLARRFSIISKMFFDDISAVIRPLQTYLKSTLISLFSFWRFFTENA